MTAGYGIITGVDNTVTAVVARRRIFIVFRTGRLGLKMPVGDECEASCCGVTESRSRQSITTHEKQTIVLGQRLSNSSWVTGMPKAARHHVAYMIVSRGQFELIAGIVVHKDRLIVRFKSDDADQASDSADISRS